MFASAINSRWIGLHPTGRIDATYWRSVVAVLDAIGISPDKATNKQVKLAIVLQVAYDWLCRTGSDGQEIADVLAILQWPENKPALKRGEAAVIMKASILRGWLRSKRVR